jgi:hypothetical protein
MRVINIHQAVAIKARIPARKQSAHERAICTAAARRNISIVRQGKAFRFLGHGIDFMAADFHAVMLDDLTPPKFGRTAENHRGLA